MDHPRQCEGRPSCVPMAHPHLCRQGSRVSVRPGRTGRSVAAETSAIPYDTTGAELGHHGEECSFDAIVKTYKIKDQAIDRLAAIVRGADTRRPDLRRNPPAWKRSPKARRLAAAEGYDDHETIRREQHLYDALYLYCGGDPKKLRRG